MALRLRHIWGPVRASNAVPLLLLRLQYARHHVAIHIRQLSATTESKNSGSDTKLPPITSPTGCSPQRKYAPKKACAAHEATPSWSQWPPPANDVKEKGIQGLTQASMRRNVQGYMFKHFFDYIKNYEKLLEKNFPSAVKAYHTYVDGVMHFYNDMKAFLKITRILNNSSSGLKALNRKELELYMQMPRDMMKVAPAMIGAALPVIGYVVLPLIFAFPEKCLCSHFWTAQQRSQYQQSALQKRLRNNKPVLRMLQAKLHLAKHHDHHDELKEILGMLGSGFHPSVQSLLNVKDIFAHPPYDLFSLNRKQINLLCKLHGVPTIWFKSFHLSEHAFLVHHMDLAIVREGHVHNIHPDSIRRCCFIRGLNPNNLSNEEMITWMRNWITISTSIQEQHISMFLYLPILLAYNHPNNWHLIYD